MLANTAAILRKHKEKQKHVKWIAKSQEVCLHYRKGFCFRGDSCKYAHLGHQKKNTTESTLSTSTERNCLQKWGGLPLARKGVL